MKLGEQMKKSREHEVNSDRRQLWYQRFPVRTLLIVLAVITLFSPIGGAFVRQMYSVGHKAGESIAYWVTR